MTVTNFIYDFTTPQTWINQGGYWERRVLYYEGAIAPSSPYNFGSNGWSNPAFQVRRYQDRTSELYFAGTESGFSIGLGSDGYLTLTMSSDLTNSFNWTDGYYEVQATMPDGTNEFRLLYGKIQVNAEVIG